VVDPMNEIVESNEEDNVKPVPEELESSSPLLDVAREVVGKTALPFRRDRSHDRPPGRCVLGWQGTPRRGQQAIGRAVFTGLCPR